MIRRFSPVLFAVFFGCFFAGKLFAQSDVMIDIHEPGASKIKIGIPTFAKDPYSFQGIKPGFEEEITQVLRDDLVFTGLFDVFASSGQPAGNPAQNGMPPSLNDWIPLDVQSVVLGKYGRAGEKIRLDCALFDVESETRIVGKYYTGAQAEARRLVHAFADEIVYRYTGRSGINNTSIAYVKRTGKNKEIHIMDYDGHNSYRLTYDGSLALSPAWSPDGDKIAFTSYKDRNPDIHIIDLKGRIYRRLSGFIGLNTTPAFSPDGKTLALTLSKDGNPEVYLMDIRSGGMTRLTKNAGIDTSPKWSPNGREMAFVSDRSGSPQVYIMDREGGNLRRITFSGSYNTSPAWSPSGDKIAYVSMVAGKGEIFMINPRGADAARITYDGGNEDPCWSPDGMYLAFSSKVSGVRDIYIMRADGTGKRRVTSGGGDNMSPAWSP